MATPFEDAFVQDLQLFGRGPNELAGVGESGKEGILEDIYFAAGGGGAVTYRVEVAVQLEDWWLCCDWLAESRSYWLPR